jgi:hypothetical protein
MTMRFIVGGMWQGSGGRLVYRNDEQSFDFQGMRPNGVASLLVNDLQLELNEAGLVLYVWGLCPRATWLPAQNEPPVFQRRTLSAQLGEGIVPGVSKRISGEAAWPVHENTVSRWICVGDPGAVGHHDSGIEFAAGCVAVLRRDTLVSLWLHPT